MKFDHSVYDTTVNRKVCVYTEQQKYRKYEDISVLQERFEPMISVFELSKTLAV